MTVRPYQVNKTGTTPAMLGRERLFEVLYRQLTKATPDHVTVVGPRLFGKTVLLHHLAQHVRPGHDGYLTSVYWDLGHGSPATDQEFYECLARLIKAALENVKEPLAAEIDPTKGKKDLDDVFDLLVLDNKRILVVMDGFDRVLSVTGLTRNLWDGLKALGDKKSLWFVTGSRKRLRELCKTEASQTSDFWEIFNPNPTRVGRLEDHDWDGFLKPYTARGVTFDGSARKELQNWTGGVPVLAAALLDVLHDRTTDGATVTKNEVDAAAGEVSQGYGDWLAALWDDCSEDMQSDLATLLKGESPAAEFQEDRRRELEFRGYVNLPGKSIKLACRLMEKHTESHANQVANLRRLFGDSEKFRENVRGLLELRIRQVRSPDGELFNTVWKAVRDLDEPPLSLGWARTIANRALKLIWDKELPTGEIPIEWVHDLKQSAPADRKVPRRAGQQCGLLRAITGTDDIPKLTKWVTKPTYTLVDHIQTLGDLGQHRDDERITWSYAAAFCFAAIELLDSLYRDFSS
jgi:hypothetical protein